MKVEIQLPSKTKYETDNTTQWYIFFIPPQVFNRALGNTTPCQKHFHYECRSIKNIPKTPIPSTYRSVVQSQLSPFTGAASGSFY